MKKLYILAALLMATTSAQAGGISFQINGERIRVEAPRNCNAISCVKVISPGYTGTIGNVDLKGMGKKKSDDDDVVTSAPGGTSGTRAGPGRCAAAPCSRSGGGTRPCADHRRAATPLRTKLFRPSPLPPAPPAPAATAPVPLRLRSPPRPTRTRRSASGRRKRTRATFASRNAAAICAAIPSTPAQDPDQHEAAGQQMDRPDP